MKETENMSSIVSNSATALNATSKAAASYEVGTLTDSTGTVSATKPTGNALSDTSNGSEYQESAQKYESSSSTWNAEKGDTVYNVNSTENNYGIHDGNGLGESAPNPQSDYLYIPNWNLKDFINERMKFRQQIVSGDEGLSYAEKGMYFFRLFFNFNTSYGLLGHLVKNSTSRYVKATNTAWQYLVNNISSGRFGSVDDKRSYAHVLSQKLNHLESFGKTLNYLSSDCPWFFKEVTGLNEALAYNFKEIVNDEEKSFSINMNPDTVDMRVSALFDMYKYACFDLKNFREIIPDNLRRFDVCIIMFNPPIVDSAYGVKNSLEEMTYKAVVFKNCQFNLQSLLTIPEQLNNAEGFENNINVKVNFERAYQYDFNKQMGISISDLFYIGNDDDITAATIEETPSTTAQTAQQTDSTEEAETIERTGTATVTWGNYYQLLDVKGQPKYNPSEHSELWFAKDLAQCKALSKGLAIKDALKGIDTSNAKVQVISEHYSTTLGGEIVDGKQIKFTKCTVTVQVS